MQLLRTLALRGPNIWSKAPMIEAWVDLGEWNQFASNEIPGFNERLKGFLPSLIEHRCSVGERGGFYVRLERGTYLGHILEHVVLELQTLAGTDVGFGKTRETHKEGVYKVAFRFKIEELGKAALEVGIRLVMAAVKDTPFDITFELEKLKEVYNLNRNDLLTEAILKVAKDRFIPARVLDRNHGLIQLGFGANQRRILGGQTDGSTAIGQSIAQDRDLARPFLYSLGIPTPWGRPVTTIEEVKTAVEEYGFPVILRNRWIGAYELLTPVIRTMAELEPTFLQAKAQGWILMLDYAGEGVDYRFLVIGKQIVAAYRYDDASNLIPVTDFHPAIRERAIEAAIGLKLDVAEVQARFELLDRSLEEQSGVIVGVHPAPNLKGLVSLNPNAAEIFAAALIDRCYADPKQSRIPTVAVTGVNGKTTTSRLTAHLLGEAYSSVGMTCTEGVYIGQRRIMTGDCSGPKSARVVLQHPDPKAAVLETARGGILREGLGYRHCEVAIVTNVGEGDHLGIGDIETPEQLANVKSTIVWAVAPWGTAVLNAHDPLVVEMRELCHGTVTFFGWGADQPVIAEHLANGGRAVYVESNELVFQIGGEIQARLPLANVPLTQGGMVDFHVENAMASAAAGWFLGVPFEKLAHGLSTFRPGLDHVPARFNLMSIDSITICLDYGHNLSALQQILKILDRLPHKHRTVVYSAAGDRRNIDMLAQGELLGNFFDRVFLYEDQYVRGRAEGEIFSIFREGLSKGKRTTEITDIKGGILAIERALTACSPGELLVVQPDTVDEGVAFMRQFLDKGGRELSLAEAMQGPQGNCPTLHAESPIRLDDGSLGKAVRAKRRIEVGEVLFRGWGVTTQQRSRHTIQVDHDLMLIPPSPLRFLNHSCDPNCGVLIRTGIESIELHAIRPIEAEEELTLDYETFEMEFRDFTGACLCGTPACRSRLIGYRNLSAERRNRYGIYIAEYLRESDSIIVVPSQEEVTTAKPVGAPSQAG
jgi:cyanophycin synthetase